MLLINILIFNQLFIIIITIITVIFHYLKLTVIIHSQKALIYVTCFSKMINSTQIRLILKKSNHSLLST